MSALSQVPFLAGYNEQDQINRGRETQGLQTLSQMMGLQNQQRQMRLQDLEYQKKDQQQQILNDFASKLPPEQRAAFLVDPKGFIEGQRSENEIKDYNDRLPKPMASDVNGFEALPATQPGAPFEGEQAWVGNAKQEIMKISGSDLPLDIKRGVVNQIMQQQRSGGQAQANTGAMVSRNPLINADMKFRAGLQDKQDARQENRDFITNVVEAGKDRRFNEGEAGKDRRVLKATSFGDVSQAGQAYFDSMPPDKQALVKGLLDYSIDPKSFSQRGANREQAIAAAKLVDPSFNTMKYGIRYSVVQDFTKGKTADNIVAIDQAINHMGTLGQLAETLKNGDVQSVNNIVNAVSKQFGDPRITNLELASQAVGEELMRVFRQVGASEREAQAWEEKFKASKSPEQMIGAIQTGTKLLSGRINAVNNRWNNGMDVKTGYPNILSDEAKQTMEKYGVSVGNSSEPSQNSSRFNSPEKAKKISGDDEFNKLEKGDYYIGPDGVKRRK